MTKNIEKASPEMILSAAARIASKMSAIGATHERVDSFIKNGDDAFYLQIEQRFGPKENSAGDRENLVIAPARPLKPIDYLPTIEDCLTAWPEFCKDFGLAIEIDFEALKIDPHITGRKAGFDWVVYCPKGFTARQAFALCKRVFKKTGEYITIEDYSYERDPKATNLVLCRATVEPDKEWLNSTSDEMRDAKVDGKPVQFLDHRERYMLEAFYFWLTKGLTGKGKHLDLVGWTRCPRSRNADGGVAGACWGNGFGACWDYAGLRDPSAGGREAISLVS